MRINITVNIPDSKFCTKCLFLREVIESWGMEASHHECAFLNEQLDNSAFSYKRVKKSSKCPVKVV